MVVANNKFMNSLIKSFISECESQFHTIPEKRQVVLQKLATAIQSADQKASLISICTHNSRRSHLVQFGLIAAAAHYGIDNIDVYSGGTEKTQIHSNTVATLKKIGFSIDELTEKEQPYYIVKHSENATPSLAFSKIYDHKYNPKNDFIAIMTCAQADAECPYIPEAKLRISLPFEDPKRFDDSENPLNGYMETAQIIFTEMLFTISQINNNE